ncbi:tegumental antigen [Echinococcus multilocularis]|uniref:Tegumental antigen n=1 Tax=Echinococcus multilocularis TaxID=6211 RepID=A0A068XVG4_ECHMU|nr:tegumental antigen [Echinococcus multilocularis]
MHQGSRNALELVEVDPFTQAFYEIDTDSDGIITRVDLEDFVRKNDIEDDTLVRSWVKLFEPSEGGFITMKLYREKLGLLEDDKRCSRSLLLGSSEMQNYLGLKNPKIRVISASMPNERQSEIIGQICHFASSGSGSSSSSDSKFNEAQVVADLKRWLDSRYGRAWHVLLIRGAYWMHYSHEIDCALQFQLGSYVYLLWRTPAG